MYMYNMEEELRLKKYTEHTDCSNLNKSVRP